MPIQKRENFEGELVDRYVVPFAVITTQVTLEDLKPVYDHRKDYAGTIEQFHKMQKEFAAAKDYASAKEMKDPIKHFTQLEKAATLVINYFTKDVKLTTIGWPVELTDVLDYEFNTIEAQWWKKVDAPTVVA